MLISAKYQGHCCQCHQLVRRGDRCYWNPAAARGKKIRCMNCGSAPSWNVGPYRAPGPVPYGSPPPIHYGPRPTPSKPGKQWWVSAAILFFGLFILVVISKGSSKPGYPTVQAPPAPVPIYKPEIYDPTRQILASPKPVVEKPPPISQPVQEKPSNIAQAPSQVKNASAATPLVAKANQSDPLPPVSSFIDGPPASLQNGASGMSSQIAGSNSTATPRTYSQPTYTRTTTPSTGYPFVAENGSYYGEPNANGVPKTVGVSGYYRQDGTYVRGYYRSPPNSNPRRR